MKRKAAQFIGKISDQVARGAGAADKTVHKAPYKAISLAATAAAVAGFFIGRRFALRSTGPDEDFYE